MAEINESLIEPVIYSGPGCCPICGSSLILSESERNIFLLNKDGSVRKFIDDADITCIAKCFTCNKQYHMVRSHGIYRHYSYAGVLFADLDYQHDKESKNNGRYKINGNPLSK